MKRLIYLLAGAALLGGFSACDDDKDNPGDFSLKSTLELGNITSKNGRYYPLVVEETKDTVYEYFYNVNDTLKDESGEPIPDQFGDPQVTVRQESYFSKKTAKLVRMKQVVLFSTEDELTIPITSNARWLAPEPRHILNGEAKDPWLLNIESTTKGGGDAFLKLKASNTRSKRTVGAFQSVLSSDSMIMYIIPFTQVGRNQTPEGYDPSLDPGIVPAE